MSIRAWMSHPEIKIAVDEDQAEIQSHIVVSRTSDNDIKIREIEMRLDGKFVRLLRYGHAYDFNLEPGKHRLTATNRLFSRTIEFTVEPGDTAWFMATGIPLEGAWHILTLLGTIPFAIGLALLPNFDMPRSISPARPSPRDGFDGQS